MCLIFLCIENMKLYHTGVHRHAKQKYVSNAFLERKIKSRMLFVQQYCDAIVTGKIYYIVVHKTLVHHAPYVIISSQRRKNNISINNDQYEPFTEDCDLPGTLIHMWHVLRMLSVEDYQRFLPIYSIKVIISKACSLGLKPRK